MKKKTPPAKSAPKPTPKPKLTDIERHKRFVDMAHEVEADERTESFDQAFDRVVEHSPNSKNSAA
jgi:hypothetical protein